MRNLINKIRNRKRTRGQTALEYALVVAAISLVIMAAWNQVGDKVKNAIRGDMLNRINNNLTIGNDAVKQ